MVKEGLILAIFMFGYTLFKVIKSFYVDQGNFGEWPIFFSIQYGLLFCALFFIPIGDKIAVKYWKMLGVSFLMYVLLGFDNIVVFYSSLFVRFLCEIFAIYGFYIVYKKRNIANE